MNVAVRLFGTCSVWVSGSEFRKNFSISEIRSQSSLSSQFALKYGCQRKKVFSLLFVSLTVLKKPKVLGSDPVTGYPVSPVKKEVKEADLTPQQVSSSALFSIFFFENADNVLFLKKADIKSKFDKFDKDKSGTLDRAELKSLLEETLKVS